MTKQTWYNDYLGHLYVDCNTIPGIIFQCVDQKLVNIDACGVSVLLTGV